MAYRKHAFQFGFDEVSSRSSTDEETAHLNPVAEEDEEDYDDEEVSSFENAYAPGPESPYLIPTSPSTISYSPSISQRYSSHYSSEPTDAYPDEGDSTSSGYNFRDHLKRPGTPATRYTRRFQTRLVTEELPKPWLTERDTREKWVTLLPYLGMCLGLGVAIYLGYSGWASVETHNYCLVYQDNFDTFNTSIWNHEVQIGGFGTGEFEWTTADPANSYVQNNTLVIMPTLTDQGVLTDTQISNGFTLNLTADGTCTSDEEEACVAISNSTSQTIINPVRSARLSTKGSRWIKFGKVEVVAKLPVGDWLWPAIWMMPVNDTYGPWPASGEIDICESRGNAINYPQGGVNTYSSTLHWGPEPSLDRWWMTYNAFTIAHTTYAEGFHTYGLEWSQNRILTYLDNQLQQVLYVPFNAPRWQIGNFPLQDANGTTLVDPWSQTGSYSTPWDQEFYLILSLAVGATNGYFPDNMGSKPWVDASPHAMYDFWAANETWYPTWGEGLERALQIQSVKMWQQCD